MNGKTKCGIDLQWNITHPLKRKEIPTHATIRMNLKDTMLGSSLVVQWLRLLASTAGSVGSIPGRGTKIPHAARKVLVR